jgi:hypothetical protein
LVSAGLAPKFGPHRLYLQLARRLAAEGFLTLRFDLGGIGDTPLLPSTLPLAIRTANEIAAAVDYLGEQYQPDGIILGGLCSGATDALRHAEGDLRVRAVILIDPFSYRTPGAAWRYFLHRVLRRCLRLLGIFQPLVDTPTATEAPRPAKRPRLIEYKYMALEESSRILRVLIARGVQLHFVYTGGMIERINHPSQLRAMFPGLDFGGLLTVDHFPWTAHTQILSEDREAIVEAISRRLAAGFPRQVTAL